VFKINKKIFLELLIHFCVIFQVKRPRKRYLDDLVKSQLQMKDRFANSGSKMVEFFSNLRENPTHASQILFNLFQPTIQAITKKIHKKTKVKPVNRHWPKSQLSRNKVLWGVNTKVSTRRIQRYKPREKRPYRTPRKCDTKYELEETRGGIWVGSITAASDAVQYKNFAQSDSAAWQNALFLNTLIFISISTETGPSISCIIHYDEWNGPCGEWKMEAIPSHLLQCWRSISTRSATDDLAQSCVATCLLLRTWPNQSVPRVQSVGIWEKLINAPRKLHPSRIWIEIKEN